TSRRFFVNYTRRPDGHKVVSRYRRMASNPLRADAASRFDLRWPGGQTFIVQPFANHNADDLQFGSDGYLYIPLGAEAAGTILIIAHGIRACRWARSCASMLTCPMRTSRRSEERR